MAEYSSETERFSQQAMQSKQKAEQRLQEQLAARRKRQRDRAIAKVSEEEAQANEAAKKDEAEAVAKLDEEAARLDVEEQKRRAEKEANDLRQAQEQALLQQQQQQAGALAPGQSAVGAFDEQQFLELINGSALYQRACEIEAMLEAGSEAGQDDGKKKTLPHGANYIDQRDAQWTNVGSNTSLVDINQLTARNFVVYQFGTFVVRLLRQRVGTPQITLLLATSLPANDYSGNAFRNSYHYKPENNVLFVRKERMDDVGEFTLVIMHALAHIAVEKMEDDANPRFLDFLYKAMRICCTDLFLTRSRPAAIVARGKARGQTADLETVFRELTSRDEKTDLTEELVNVKVVAPTDKEFTEQAVSERISRYSTLSSAQDIQDHVQASMSAATATVTSDDGEIGDDFIRARLVELSPATSADQMDQPRRPRSTLKRSKSTVSSASLFTHKTTRLHSELDELNEEMLHILRNVSELEARGAPPANSDAEKTIRGLKQQRDALNRRINSLTNEIERKERSRQG
eukprot:scpid2405/ scgid31345/ 